jgi:DNA-binding NarL/FixJ family response regulator
MRGEPRRQRQSRSVRDGRTAAERELLTLVRANGEALERLVGAVTELVARLDRAAPPLCAPDLLPHPGNSPLRRLSERERQVLGLIARGYSIKRTAAELGLAPTTVSTHRARIFEKLGVTDLPALIRLTLLHEEPL